MTLITRAWYLEVNSVPLATPAWEIPDLDDILNQAPLRGEDDRIPSVAGVIPNPRRVDVQIVTFPLDIFGDFDTDGGAVTDPMVGMVSHRDYLAENLGYANSTGDGTVTAIFHRSTLDPISGDVHFLGLKGWATDGIGYARTTFDLSIPAGMLEEIGS